MLDLPENADVMAAMRKEMVTAGPATSLATAPARTYTPTPRVLPTPRAVRSFSPSTLASLAPVDAPVTSSSSVVLRREIILASSSVCLCKM